MEHRRVGRDVFVRLDVGDEMHASIRELSEHGISAAAITSGIGRIRNTVIGYLDADGVYQKEVLEAPVELLSTQGNLAPGPDGAFTHIHIVASDDDHTVHGGHLFEATVEVTAEMHLRVLGDEDSPFKREATDSEFLWLSFCDLG
jgi:predicted DNA-binding protein with PD1-like motif|tara:strand:- start:849 stop:1283 length:435 start_codon:yes stop_codon:yes gene_type:complete